MKRVHLAWDKGGTNGVTNSPRIKFLGREFLFQTKSQEGGGVSLELIYTDTGQAGAHGHASLSKKMGVYTTLNEAIARAETHLGDEIDKLFHKYQVVFHDHNSKHIPLHWHGIRNI